MSAAVLAKKKAQVRGGSDEGPSDVQVSISDPRVKNGIEQGVREVPYLWGFIENPLLYSNFKYNPRIS